CVDDVLAQLFDHVANGLEVANRWLSRVCFMQGVRAALLNALQCAPGNARFVRDRLRLRELRRGLLLRLLADVEHLLKPKLERRHCALRIGTSICCAIDRSALVDTLNAELSSGSCWRNSST